MAAPAEGRESTAGSSRAPGRPARPALRTGDLVAERYRLVQPVAVPDSDVVPTALWLATDEVLARPVALRLLPTSGRAGRSTSGLLLTAASAAARLSLPGLARVYDAAVTVLPREGTGRPLDVTYVVTEWVEGTSLADRLRADGGLDPRVAARLTRRAAEALEALHDSGLTHGRIHPGNVLLGPDERITLTDAVVSAALHDGAAPPARLDPGAAHDDVVDLAAVLYALLTARWPTTVTPQPARGLAAAPRGAAGAAVYGPRQVRAGVPRALDTLVLRTLEPARYPGQRPLDSAAALVRALSEVDLGPVEQPAGPPPPPTPLRERIPSPLRRATPFILVMAFLLTVGVAFRQIGQQVGQLPRRAGAIDQLVEPSAQPSAGVGAPIDLSRPPVVVRDFDPADGMEQRGSVPNAFDGDPSTAWSTDGYDSAAFGGLKNGVGLLVDLGRPTLVGSVKVGLTLPGATVELRAANERSPFADRYSVLARAADVKQVATLTPSSATPQRYWLVWIPKLAEDDGGRFRAGIPELVFTRGR